MALETLRYIKSHNARIKDFVDIATSLIHHSNIDKCNKILLVVAALDDEGEASR